MSQLDSIGIAKQSAFGTKQATPEYYIDVESFDFDGTPDLMDVETTIGYSYAQPLEAGTQVFKVSGKMIPRVASLPEIIQSFWGVPISTTADTSAKKHSFNPVAPTGPAPYMSILINRTDPSTAITDLAYDCRGSKFTISTKTGDFVHIDCDWLGASNDDTQSEPTPTLDATERLKWHNVKVYANIDGAGEAEIKVSDMEFTWDNKIEDDHYVLGSQTLVGIPIGTRPEASFNFTLDESDASTFLSWYRNALKSSSRPSIVYRIVAEGSLIGATTQKAGFEIKIWNAEVTKAPANVDAKNRMRSLSVENRCNYSTGDSKIVTGDFYNVVASY